MSEIKLQCVEQNLHLLTKPEIFSGDVNYDTISVDFDKTWDNFTKTAIFYQSKDTVYYQLLDMEDKAIIPKEVLTYKGDMYLGVFGVKGDVVITSEVLMYKIRQGVPTEELIIPNPRPDIFEQIIADYNAIKLVIDRDYNEIKEDYEATKEDLQTDYETSKADLQEDYNNFSSVILKAVEDMASDLNGKSEKNHNHDDRYYTENEVDNKLSGKSDKDHDHDDRYYTENEVNVKLANKLDSNRLTVLSGEIATTLVSGQLYSQGVVQVNYPNGFHKSNCIVIGAMVIESNVGRHNNIGFTRLDSAINNFVNPLVNLMDNYISITARNNGNAMTLGYKVALYRYA